MGTKNNPISIDDSEENIDFGWIFFSLKANKKIISLITVGGLLFSSAYSLFRKKTWEGQMQIVIKQDGNPGSSPLEGGMNSSLLNAIGISTSQVNNIRTEVEILKSPSVLMPIFNFVKESKTVATKKDKNNLTFNSWIKDDLNVFLKPGTNVLELIYKDTDKNIIITVLTKISKEYQKYSVKNRNENFKEGLKYLEEQLDIFKEKSKQSSKDLTEFEIINSINEKILITNKTAVSEYEMIKEQLELIKKMKDDDEKITSLYSIIYKLDEGNDEQLGILKSIEITEDKIATLRSTYKDSHRSIQDEIYKKKEYVKLLKPKLLNHLNSLLNTNEVLIKATSRDKEVLMKYVELLNEAKSDAEVFNKLSLKYRLTLLEQAKNTQPWELITSPTLLEKSVSMSNINFIFLRTIIFFLLSATYVLIKEKIKNLVTKKSIMEEKIPADLVQYIRNFDGEAPILLELLIAKIAKKTNNKSFCIVFLGQMPEIYIKKTKKLFSENKDVSNLSFLNNISTKIENENLIVISALGIITEEELRVFNQSLLLQDKKIDCLFIIERDLNNYS